ncbi:MAG: YdcF family protein [Anaerolineaceae bacterium]
MKQLFDTQKPDRGFKGLSLVLGIPMILIVILLLGGIILTAMGGILIIADPLRSSDAVVVLSGGGDMSRLEEGARIFLEKDAQWVILTETTPGEGEKVSGTTILFKDTARNLGIPDSAILVTKQAAFSTLEEAQQTLELANRNSFKSLIIVTDPFHTFRTRLIFRSVFKGSGIDIYVRPVRGHWYHSTNWWMTAEGRRATVSEYVKIIAYLSGLKSGLVE